LKAIRAAGITARIKHVGGLTAHGDRDRRVGGFERIRREDAAGS
jgi:hypothetical protein